DESADRVGDDVEDEQRGPADEHGDGQQHREHHVDVGEVLDAALDAGDGGGDEAGGEHRDDDHQDGGADVRQDPGGLDAAADLQGAQAQRAGRAEQGRQDREDVDDAPADALGDLL